jgi:hypothetical protein
MTPYSVIASPDLSGRSNVAAASCHCEGRKPRSNLGGDNRDCQASLAMTKREGLAMKKERAQGGKIGGLRSGV